MAKDDYPVIVYKVLSYLYIQLKRGADVDPECLTHDGTLFQINQKYWTYIMTNGNFRTLFKPEFKEEYWKDEHERNK